MKTRLLILCLFLFGITAGCQNNDLQFQGEMIEIDFNNASEFRTGLWLQIDDWVFAHVESLEEGNETEFALPMDYVIIDRLPEEDRDFKAPVNPKNIGIHIGRHLNEINNNSLAEGEPKYDIPNPALLTATGILQIVKNDSSTITIKVPNDYPLSINAKSLQ